MHVAIVCPYSMSRPGGAQAHARGLARALVRLGHGVTLLGPELRERLDGVVTVSLGGAVRVPANGSVAPLGIDPRMLVRFDLALDPADVVHLHEPFLPASLFALVRRPERTAVVGTFHAAAERFWPYALGAPLVRRLSRRLDATTAVSPEARRLVRRYAAIDPEIVPNGVDVAAFEEAPCDEWAASLGKVVLWIGRPEPRKGFEVVARAFARAARDIPQAHLVMSLSLEDLPPDVGHERIHCIGPVDEARKLALHRAARIVCCASTGGESFGIVMLEGLAGGSAVLASDLPGYRYAGGEAVRYVPPGDVEAWAEALGELLRDDEATAELARAGPPRARAFDWTVVGAQTVRVYERALAS